MQRPVLKLYVAGRTSRSENAIRNLTRVCDEELDVECEIVIIDVVDNPELAETDKIMVTPTLVKVSPPPSRRILGDLSDTQLVITGLNLPVKSDD